VASTGNAGTLSTLDQALKSLGEWLLTSDAESASPIRKFKIILPSGGVKIKNEITVTQFERLCNKETTNLSTLALFRTN